MAITPTRRRRGIVLARRKSTQLWSEYVFLGELYQFYLDLVVRTAVGYFVVLGTIVTVVLANVSQASMLSLALSIPILMSLLLAIAAVKVLPKVRELHKGISRLGARLRVQVKPHVELLEWSLRGGSILLLASGAMVTGLMTWLVLDLASA